jgi:hypothetical protein
VLYMANSIIFFNFRNTNPLERNRSWQLII